MLNCATDKVLVRLCKPFNWNMHVDATWVSLKMTIAFKRKAILATTLVSAARGVNATCQPINAIVLTEEAEINVVALKDKVEGHVLQLRMLLP